jgi:hypothetical protein
VWLRLVRPVYCRDWEAIPTEGVDGMPTGYT